MTNPTKKSVPGIRLASPPCLLQKPDADSSLDVDADQARDVARWRKVQRERLIHARSLLSAAQRAQFTERIAQQLTALIRGGQRNAPTVSVYWPIRAEPDLRAWMKALPHAGVRVALPVALAVGQPLIFRAWRPRAKMRRGLWNIPYPADGELVVPDVVIAPLVGFDRAAYRLGYGGGFFDRTLAQLNPKPLTLGIGFAAAELPTIYPQPHDIPMDWVITPETAFRAPA